MKVSRRSPTPDPAPLVEVIRGSLIESRHRGHIAAVEPPANIVAQLGAPEVFTYLRSSAKPYQTIPLIVSGAADRFGLTPAEIALACASHSGEEIHVEIVKSMLQKVGLTPSALKCGTHEPFSHEVSSKLRESGKEPDVLQNNCSGKHAGMLALARHLGAPTETYDRPDNPVQVAIAVTISAFSDTPVEKLTSAIDGCGVPVFAVSVKALALMYLRLVAPPSEFDEPTRNACERVVAAMIRYPELIGGTKGRLDTEIIRAGKERLVSKVGAEGVYTLGLLPCAEWPRGLGLALKIEDGDDHRARPTVVIESLRQLGILKDEALEAVAPYSFFHVRNHRGEPVGKVRAAFNLKRID